MSSLQWTMLGFFLLLVTLSIWKLKAFLSVTQVADDDRTPQAIEQLYDYLFLVLDEVLTESHERSHEALFEEIIALECFDRDYFWRFNPNRLEQLIRDFYARHPDVESLDQMHERLKSLKR